MKDKPASQFGFPARFFGLPSKLARPLRLRFESQNLVRGGGRPVHQPSSGEAAERVREVVQCDRTKWRDHSLGSLATGS